MEFKTAFTATENRTFAVPLVDISAVRALLRSVSSIYEENAFSKTLRLIADKLLKLIERPAIKLSVELFASSLQNPNLAQIFKSKYSVFRVHNLLRYAVICISRKPSFPARQTLKLAFGRPGAFGLQLFPKIGILSTPVFDLLGVEEHIIRADSNIHYPAIYPKNFETCNLLRFVVLQGHMQIEHLVSAIIGYCRGLDSPAKVFSVMRWHKESRLESSPGTGYRSQAVHKVDGYNSLVVSHCRKRFSLGKRLTFSGFQSFACTIPGSLDQRGRKIWDALTGKLVGGIVVINLVPRVVLESPFCGSGERVGVSSHRIEESPTILVSQPKLEC